jgi:prepilin peptidase dependent protein B
MSIKQQTGLSLVELLIGMLVGLVVAAGGISLFTVSVKGQSDNVKLSRLNQDLRAMMDVMERDIRRAGFVTSDPDTNSASLQNNPFFGATTDLAVYDGGSCIVYAYNRDDDPDNDGLANEVPSAVDSNEFMGFRLNNNGKLEMRKSGTTNADCSSDNGIAYWESITESEVEITGLTFTLTSTPLNVTSMINDDDGDGMTEASDSDGIPYGDDNGNGVCDASEVCNTCTRNGSPDPACLYVRNVTITLTGRLQGDQAVTQTIVEQVRVRNDKYLAAIP